ncbi:MAG: flagellar biosynthetic protein FliR [Deltaproteobacteria bacterium]|nr:flagellar biosynthetic protein FliR [Deltaproteobacteria bacterium]
MKGSLDFMEMIKPETIVLFTLVLVRIGGIFLASPMLSNSAVPRRVKLAITIACTFLLLPILKVPPLDQVKTEIGLIVLILQELTIGVVLGFAASVVFSAIQSAGEIFGTQIGFSIATVFDPANEGSAGVLTSLYVILGALIFLYLDGHHVILTAMAKSFEVLPISKGFGFGVGMEISHLTARLFLIAIQVAAPVTVVMTILSIIFGLLTKLSPQMNVYMNLGFILGPMVGMVILLLSLPLFRVVMTSLTQGMAPDLLKVMKELKGI